jgi:hypothetical protein
MNWREKVKLGTARLLLQFSDRLLGRDPETFNKFLSEKAKQHQEERFDEIRLFEEQQEKEVVNDIEEVLIRHRDMDFDFSDPEEKSDAMIMFQAELEVLIVKHLSLTSGLVVAGPLVAEAMKLYRTILPQEEYDLIVSHIYKTRNSVETTILPEDLASKTVH